MLVVCNTKHKLIQFNLLPLTMASFLVLNEREIARSNDSDASNPKSNSRCKINPLSRHKMKSINSNILLMY